MAMAEQHAKEMSPGRNQAPDAPAERELRGGTQGGEAAGAMDLDTKGGGTPGIGSASGGVHVERPSEYVPRTGLADRPVEDTRLAGGKTPEDILGYLGGMTFPAKKDTIVREARRHGAPEDVLGAMNMLSKTDYASPEDLLRDYPRLPDPDDVDPTKGQERAGRSLSGS